MSTVNVDEELWTNIQNALAHAVIANGGVLILTDQQLRSSDKVEMTTERVAGNCVIRAKLVRDL